MVAKEKRIIAFVDFSESTDKLVNYAICISQKRSAETHFINIVDLYKDDPLLDNVFVDRCEKRLLAAAQSRMEDLLTKLEETSHKCTGEVVCGSRIETIAGLTSENRSDTILMDLH